MMGIYKGNMRQLEWNLYPVYFNKPPLNWQIINSEIKGATKLFGRFVFNIAP